MLLTAAPIWKQAPFIRLLIPLVMGIIMQWYFPLSPITLVAASFIILSIFLAAQFFRGHFLFRYKWIYGFLLMLMLAVFGAYITYAKNITHQLNWFGAGYKNDVAVMVVLNEPLVEKNKSFKAVATVHNMYDKDTLKRVNGSIIVYFKKDATLPTALKYGSVIIFKKPLQEITNSGNPGAFDYKRYCLFQSITHQVYLTEKDFSIVPLCIQPAFMGWLQESRSSLLQIVKRYIPGKREAGVAEALLIGYRYDLDRDLVQAYSNTGVVHVIAISGMHLAMIYGLLILLMKPLQKRTGTKWLRGAIILAVLWTFTLLSGAGPSILRSAVMFSFIIVGESISKRISVYHSLSASAFFLLCYNPFFLWDVGFQLSYTAVLSIVIFLKPVTNWFSFKNKMFDYVWKLMAVTIAAQILTTPLSIYHFHQVPNLFLLSNLIIVPLSGIILYAEIFLCAVSFVSPVASIAGKLIALMLSGMNGFIHWVNAIPFAVSNNIYISVIQTIALYIFIIMIAVWLLQKNNKMLKYALSALLLFVVLRTADLGIKQQQQKLIVYNVPQHEAIDFIDSRQYFFAGDSVCQADDFLRNFHLTPSRLLYRVHAADTLKTIERMESFIYFAGKRILLLDSLPPALPVSSPVNVDIIILSHNAKVHINRLQTAFNCHQYIFDGSNPAWKIRQWKNECDSLHLRRHSVQENGAFVLDF